MKEFMLSAGGLTKNPLGVVGLFVCLVYGLACIVFLVNGRNLQCGESWMLVSFVAIFPCVILAVFYRLVTQHHKKLYAPSDYKDEQNFISMMSDSRIMMRLDEQIEKSTSAIPEKRQGHSEDAPPGLVARQGKTSNIYFNLDAKKAKRAEYGDAKRLAFLALEKKIGKPFTKYVKFVIEGKEIEFDGYLELKSEMHIIDIIYLEHPEIINDYIDDLVRKAVPVFTRTDEAKASMKTVWIGVVYAFSRAELQSSGITGTKPSLGHNLIHLTTSTMFLSLDELKATYG